MKISATSALVLNWSSPSLWRSDQANAYLNKLDLSEGDVLLKLFNETENYMHLQTVSGRKFYILNYVSRFLEKQKARNLNGQVIILGAGIAPASIEIAARFSNCTVFDVDKFLMSEKEMLVNGNPPNIKFIECDITNIKVLEENLLANGFNPKQPSIVVMEGIIYYITSDELLNILTFFKKHNSVFACDFCLEPETVNEKTRFILTEVFRKIMEQVGINSIKFYYENELVQLIRKAGFQKVLATNLQQIQKDRTGDKYPFDTKDSSWVKMILAE